MGKKKWIVILCSVVIFFAAAVLGFGAVTAVDDFKIKGTVYSEQAKTDAAAVRTSLLQMRGRNLLLLDSEAVSAAFAAYPYLSVRSVNRKFPNTIEIEIEEKVEVYAIAAPRDGATVYYMLDADGLILSVHERNVNNLDGGANVLLSGVTLQNPAVGQPAVGGETLARALAAASALHRALGGLRSCSEEVAVYAPTSDASDEYLVCRMAEGILIEIDDFGLLPQEKASAAAEFYVGLSDVQKLFGTLRVGDAADGGINCSYGAR